MKHIKTFETFGNSETPTHDVDKILNHYLYAALWTEELDDKYDISNIDDKTWQQSRADIESFLTQAEPYLKGITDEMIGHDFWLTRNGHGAGFWDRQNIEKEDGVKLTEICEKFPSVHVFENDNKDGVVME